MPVFFYDDTRARRFEPFALTRPVCELRSGAVLIRHRWESALGEHASGFVSSPHLQNYEELDAPVAATASLPAGSIVVNSRCVLALGAVPRDVETWVCDGRVAATRLARDIQLEQLASGEMTLETLAGAGGETESVRGRWLENVWDLIGQLADQLADDVLAVGPRLDVERPPQSLLIGEESSLFVEKGAKVEPGACFDVTNGPILVLSGAHIRAFARLVGPCSVGEGSTILGGDISVCSIGDVCKVRGEMSHTIMLGHANKGHDGFVGHSYMGRWVNLGAGTTTSNLKNTYGTVQLWTPDGQRDTGLQFLGTLFGDHVKTGIGLRLTTGCVLGAGANVYDAMPPKAVPPFSWGGAAPYDTFRIDKFIEVAERVMDRRHVALGERARQQMSDAYAARWSAD